ncbi:Leucine rich repeat-containing protein [Rubritalea squalenifaciens DSM 18772]|uniref:Leucine rich repeat-containing protein n=1 Tax=Rubritalea squalenifaciens DSM 18772 TaxID=1123071 RepID=A0A1M6GHJ5_9BACT|nr:leucine-rich repeat domain-containing protein [Rubritalea squalenifaciens]SHJ09485.1 Leucine rich repeat-containing protein [Rubritalea squalenifaciens DSM 18772]
MTHPASHSLRSAATFLLCAWVAILAMAPACIRAGTIGPLTYELVDDTSVTITLCERNVSGPVTIPADIEGLPVTTIGYQAFDRCTQLTSVIIPEGVTTIGITAFSNCPALTGVELPSTVETIGLGAFSNCTLLDNVILPQNLTSLGTSAFSGCTSLSSIAIPSGITTIPESLFRGCSSLSSVSLPAGLDVIENQAFQHCSSLTSITLPDSLASIGLESFRGCTLLETLTLPSGLSSLATAAFAGCPNLQSIVLEPGNTSYTSVDGVIYTADMKKLVVAPGGLASLGNFTVPAGVTTISDHSFSSCTHLTGITIPGSVSYLGEFAFDSCDSLASITIPSSVTEILTGCFRDCSSLVAISLPSSISSLEPSAFTNCSSLLSIQTDPANNTYTSVDGVLFSKDATTLVRYPPGRPGHYNVPPGVLYIGSDSFVTSHKLTSIAFPGGLQGVLYGAFQLCEGLTSIELPEGVQTVGAYAFSKCFLLTTVYLPDTVTTLGYATFQDCWSLETVHLSEGITAIQDRTFEWCQNLQHIVIPGGVETLGSYAFKLCSSLKSVVLPASVTCIEFLTFDGCRNLESAYFLGNAPEAYGTQVFFTAYSPGFTIYYLSGNTGFDVEPWTQSPGYPDAPGTVMYNQVEIDQSTYPAASWLLQHRVDYTSSLNSDTNGDGVTLLMEYALQLNPNTSNRNNLPGIELAETTAGLTFRGDTPGITYEVWTSTNLTDWTQDGVTLSPPGEDGIRTATIERSGRNRAFLQLRVSE